MNKYIAQIQKGPKFLSDVMCLGSLMAPIVRVRATRRSKQMKVPSEPMKLVNMAYNEFQC